MANSQLSGKPVHTRNRRLAALLAALVAGMVGLAYASVPLYELFCRVTGFGGTPQRAAVNPGAVVDRMLTIRFNADTGQALPWEFEPVAQTMTVQVGADALAYFRVHNLASYPNTGTAVFNVTPTKAAPYFVKVQCFCFEQQPLAAGATAELPVSFFVDPAIMRDPNLDDVTTITLSYTFYPAADAAAPVTAAAADDGAVVN